jgi:BNR/Asp-box repeat
MTVLLMIGTRKGLWLARSDDQRKRWELGDPHFFMQEIPACAIDTRGGRARLLVGARSEHWGPSVFHSDDDGGTWSEPAAVKAVWQLRPDTAARSGVVWAGTEPSALWRSEDGGESFALVDGLWDHPHRPTWEPGGGGQALHTVLPHPSDDERVLVAMSTGGVYRTDDGGKSWHPANQGIKAYFFPDPWPEYGQCVHKVARDADEPNRLFAQNHHGVYRSDDGGSHWVSIADGLPSDFGFPVVAHPARGGTAWVVPLVADRERVPPDATLGVWRTTDAGESWSAASSGLPEDFYASVLRDAFTADDVADPTGLYLGGRDGSVYASADEGESWSEIARHLPDILCLRAATVP